MQVGQRQDGRTPFSMPSGQIEKSRLGGRELSLLARHGVGRPGDIQPVLRRPWTAVPRVGQIRQRISLMSDAWLGRGRAA